jgi:hypothetical protein
MSGKKAVAGLSVAVMLAATGCGLLTSGNSTEAAPQNSTSSPSECPVPTSAPLPTPTNAPEQMYGLNPAEENPFSIVITADEIGNNPNKYYNLKTKVFQLCRSAVLPSKTSRWPTGIPEITLNDKYNLITAEYPPSFNTDYLPCEMEVDEKTIDGFIKGAGEYRSHALSITGDDFRNAVTPALFPELAELATYLIKITGPDERHDIVAGAGEVESELEYAFSRADRVELRPNYASAIISFYADGYQLRMEINGNAKSNAPQNLNKKFGEYSALWEQLTSDAGLGRYGASGDPVK